jgi:enoyl-CoA hydratase
MADPELLSQDLPAGGSTIRILMLNRPRARNALSTSLLGELIDALEQADGDQGVAAVVLAGAGPAFCSGGDIKEFAGSADPKTALVHRSRLLVDVQQVIPRLGVPVVAAVQGAVVGAGAALALAADVVIAAPDLMLEYPEIRGGVVPSVVSAGLVQQANRKQAFEMLTTGRRLDAEEAVRRGLVNSVAAEGEVLDAALVIARQWAAMERTALRETKRLFYRTLELPTPDAFDAGMQVLRATWEPAAH